jgi:hypothetical protein
MPLIRTGHIYSLNTAIVKHTELTEQLINLSVSSELLESTALNSPMQVSGLSSIVKIPDNLVENIYALYHYDTRLAAWTKITDFKQSNNKLVLSKPYYGILLAFPMDAFMDTFYEDGQYVYEMFLARLDTRVYRNITISSSSYLPSPFVSLSFSFDLNGPWYTSINSPFLFSTFYMRVSVTNMAVLADPQIIPSEMISITCLTCE